MCVWVCHHIISFSFVNFVRPVNHKFNAFYLSSPFFEVVEIAATTTAVVVVVIIVNTFFLFLFFSLLLFFTLNNRFYQSPKICSAQSLSLCKEKGFTPFIQSSTKLISSCLIYFLSTSFYKYLFFLSRSLTCRKVKKVSYFERDKQTFVCDIKMKP